jgi:hypothetical protein
VRQKGSVQKKSAYDHDLAKTMMSYMTTHPESGEIVDLEELTPEEMVEAIDMVPPLIPMIGPLFSVLPPNSGLLVLRTYTQILEIRNEMRPAALGLAMGDRTFKRCYQHAQRDRARYLSASDDLRAEAQKAQYAGVNIVFTGTETRGGKKYPVIRQAKPNERADAVLRAPKYAAMKAFECLNDKQWHHWLFPFGCFFYENVPDSHDAWKNWTGNMLQGRNSTYLINPYSVASTDVRYMVCSTGYLQRYMYILSIIRTLKVHYDFDVLQCNRLPGCFPADNAFRRFLTLERYFYVFGSVHMHIQEAESAGFQNGGPWDIVIPRLKKLFTTVCGDFQFEIKHLPYLELSFVRKVRTVQVLNSIFHKAEVLGAETPF